MTDVPRPDVPTVPAHLVEAVLAGNWARAAAIVDSDWMNLIAHHDQALWWMIRTVPEEVASADGLLSYIRDTLDVQPKTGHTSLRSFPTEEADLIELGRSPGIRDVLFSLLSQVSISRRAGRFQEAADVAGRSRIVADEASRVQPGRIVDILPTSWLQWGIAHLLAGHLDVAAEDFLFAYQGQLRHGLRPLAANAAGEAALCWALGGDLPRASEWLERQDAVSYVEVKGWVAEVAPAGGATAAAMVAVEHLDQQVAEVALDRLVSMHNEDELWALATYTVAQHGLLWRNAAEARRRIEDAKAANRYKPSDGVADPLLDAAGIELRLASGVANRARAELAGADLSHPAVAVAAVRLDVLTGRFDEALTAAAGLVWRPGTSPRTRLDMLLLQATAEDGLGSPQRAIEALSQAVDIARHYGLLRPFACVPRSLLTEFVPRVPGGADLLAIPALRDAPEVFPLRLEIVELTKREQEVLDALATDQSVEQIARKLFVSPATLRTQRKVLYRKLGVHSRAEAVVRAHEWGLLVKPSERYMGGYRRSEL